MRKNRPNKLEIEKLYKKDMFQKEIGKKFGFSQAGISKLMGVYGIKTKRKTPWSKIEERKLKKYYLKIAKDKLLVRFPGRTWKGLKDKAVKLRLSRSQKEYRNSKEVAERLRMLAQANAIQFKRKNKRDLSYIIGVLDGDGYTNRKGMIGLETKFLDFAEKFIKRLRNIDMHPNMAHRKGRGHWIVWASSKEFVKWYLALNFKKKLIWLLKNDPWQYLEGKYDSDGYLHPADCPLICTHKMEDRLFLLKLLTKLGIEATIQKANGVWIRSVSAHKFFKNIQSIYPHKNLKY